MGLGGSIDVRSIDARCSEVHVFQRRYYLYRNRLEVDVYDVGDDLSTYDMFC